MSEYAGTDADRVRSLARAVLQTPKQLQTAVADLYERCKSILCTYMCTYSYVCVLACCVYDEWLIYTSTASLLYVRTCACACMCRVRL